MAGNATKRPKAEPFVQVPVALVQAADPYALAVWIAIRSFCDHGKLSGAHPSDARIAEVARCGTRKVRQARVWLKDNRWLSWVSKPVPAGRLNHYTLRLEGAAPHAGPMRHDMPDPQGDAAPDAGRVRHHMPGTVDPLTVETTDTPSSPPSKPSDPPGFAEFWDAYPKRAGGRGKRDALKKWTARINDGVEPAAMIEGAKRYAAFCEAAGNVGTRFVKLPATFLGPGLHYEEEWAIPPPSNGNGARKQFDDYEYTPTTENIQWKR